LVFWAKDFGSQKVLESTKYFVYCGDFKTHLWDERFAQNPKGEFLEVPFKLRERIPTPLRPQARAERNRRIAAALSALLWRTGSE